MITSKEIHNEPVWDKAQSTFMRVIYLQNGYTLTGYSKKVGRNERRDKIDLLTNWILRDLKNGYLDKQTANSKITPLDRIDYFRKLPDGNYEAIVTLYYECPDWVEPKWMENQKLVSFITRLYILLRKGVNSIAIANELEVRTRAQRHDPLDYTIRRFASMVDLNAYVIRLKTSDRHPPEAIDHFYRQYKQKFFNL